MRFPITSTEIISVGGYSGIIFSVLSEFDGIGKQIAFTVALIFFAFVVIVWAISRAWGHRIEIIKDIDGAISLDDILKADRKILVTHFGNDIPSEPYIAMLLSVLEKGVHIIRIVHHEINIGSDQNNWLKRFEGKDGYVLLRTSSKLPFDVMVFDSRKVKLTFPSSSVADRFSCGFTINSSEVASMFETSLVSMKNVA